MAITPDEDLPDALARADRALFQAKSSGRDRVIKAQAPVPDVLTGPGLEDLEEDLSESTELAGPERRPARSVPAA